MPNERSFGPVQQALWFVENRLSDEMCLHGISEDVGVSLTVWRAPSGRRPVVRS
jgi:hypothetical protein